MPQSAQTENRGRQPPLTHNRSGSGGSTRRSHARRPRRRHGARWLAELSDDHGRLHPDSRPGARSYFAQATAADGARLDNRLPAGAWLISEHDVAVPPNIALVSLASGDLGGFHAGLAAQLQQLGARAVLVRPDRSVLGAGDPETLLAHWKAALTG